MKQYTFLSLFLSFSSIYSCIHPFLPSICLCPFLRPSSCVCPLVGYKPEMHYNNLNPSRDRATEYFSFIFFSLFCVIRLFLISLYHSGLSAKLYILELMLKIQLQNNLYSIASDTLMKHVN